MKAHEILQEATHTLNRELSQLDFGPKVGYVYNPLEYARDPWFRYLHRYATPPQKVLFLGMNPGPWGMGQTGVPFGEVPSVRDWLKITGTVTAPKNMRPERKVLGFDCTRREVSGRRLWGFFADTFSRAEDFFAHHFVCNYCPLLFFSDTGKNITPDKLHKREREALFSHCDHFLVTVISALEVGTVVGVGRFAADRASAAAGDVVNIARIAHPSPANPQANRGWNALAERQLIEQSVWKTNCAPGDR